MDTPRTAPQRDRLPSLTGLRFWAALLVVLYHLSREYRPLPWISPLVWYSRDGVTFFFVLSGFVLAWSYAGRGVPATVFYWRRLVRIGPLHLLATGFAVAVSLALGAAVAPRGVLLSLPLLQAWTRGTSTAGNPAAWSLSAEAWFYLLLPLLLPFLLRRRTRTLAALGLVASGCGLLLWLGVGPVAPPALRGWLLDYFPLSRTPQFLLGAVTGLAVRRGARVRVRVPARAWMPARVHGRPVRVPVGAAVAGLLLWHLALVRWHHAVPDGRWYGPYSASQLLVAPLFALLIATAAGRDADGRTGRLGSPWMRRLGHWSFAWYLVHQTCLRLALATFGPPHGPWQTLGGWLLVLALSLALAAALHTWVEHPVEAHLRTRGPGAYTPQAATAPPQPQRPLLPGARTAPDHADAPGAPESRSPISCPSPLLAGESPMRGR
ncbi:acyltransferase family protein [Streptacidiphilus sp. N1-3]|uniref:Acyltransferase family protein n=1 Tax=Streptacidiphilus alkalitolerans TaxID=3342712 RepID=A0ABV6WUY3_9ACTN